VLARYSFLGKIDVAIPARAGRTSPRTDLFSHTNYRAPTDFQIGERTPSNILREHAHKIKDEVKR